MKVTFLNPTPYKLLTLYLIIAVTIIYSGLHYYFERKEEIKEQHYSELASITEYKSKIIENWRAVRIGNAGILSSNTVFTKAVADYLKNKNNIEETKKFDSRLSLYIKYFDYSNIMIVDKDFNVVFLKGEKKSPLLEKEAVNNLKKCFSENNPVISEPFRSDIDSSYCIDVSAPLYSDGVLVGGIILRTGPNQYLFYEINNWPITTKTGDIGLIVVRNNEIVFLDNLTHGEPSGLKFKIKIDSSTAGLTSVMAANGLRGNTEGIDYRGKKTFNNIREINNSDWILIAKMDQEEVFAPLYRGAFTQSLIALFFLLLFGFGLFWIWSNRKKSLVIQKLEEEKTRMAIKKNYEHFIKYANDVIILSDDKFNIKDVNERAEKMYGYTRDELLMMNIKDLVIKELHPLLDIKEKEVEKIKEGIIYEAVHKTKSGKFIPVEISLNIIETEGNAFFQRIVRDITERKNAENKLREEYNFREAIEECMGSGIVVVDNLGIQSYVNSRFAEMVGWEKDELVGKNAPFVYWPEEELENINNMFQLTLQSKAPKEGFDSVFMKKSGERFPVHFIISELKNAAGDTIGWLAVVNDTTEKKASEEKLIESDKITKALINATTDTVLMIDLNGTLLAANENLIRKYGGGITYDEFIGRNIFDFFKNEKSKNLRRQYLIEVLKTGKPMRFTEEYLENEEILDHSIYPIYDKNGKIYRLAIFGRDITQSKKAEIDLRKSEEKYRGIFESTQDVFHRVDNLGIVTEISPSVFKLLGFKREEVVGKPVADFYLNPAEMQSFIDLMFKDGKVDDYELVLKDINNNPVFISVSAHVRTDDSSNFIGTEGVFRNIAERKKYEDSLKENERKYRTLVETMHDGIMQVDNDDIILFVNESTCKMFGYKEEELLGMRSRDAIIHPDDAYIVVQKNSDRKRGVASSYEIRGIKKSGELLWLNISGTPVYNNEGIVIGSVGFIVDITGRKKNEEEINKISQAINQSPIIIIISDKNGNIEYVNPKFTEITGYQPDEVLGKNPGLLKSGYTSPEEYQNLWNTILSGKEWTGEFYNKKKNGEYFWERASISSVKDSSGNITHFIAIKEDVTEAKQKELELIRAKEKAEESERLKSSFLANMSHELRTPMVGILGFSELLKDITTEPEMVEYAETIHKSGKRLMETLNLILDLSRIEAGKLDVNKKNVNIYALVKESFESFLAVAKTKNLETEFIASSDVIVACVDEKLLFESVNNLINNAVKYTKHGKVTVSISTTKKDALEIAVIKVKDTGIGIPKESLELIFEEFRQASEGYGRVFEGTGLGLTITKNFVEKTGGFIYVESEENKGSVFTIEIPLIKELSPGGLEKETEPAGISAKPEKEINILCIEDEESTRFFVSQIMKNIYPVKFAENGVKALEMVKSENFNIILMDVNLGKGVNGIDVTKEIRSLENSSAIRIIAMTAYAMTGDKERFLNAGMDNYISKPFNKSALFHVINEEVNYIKNNN